MVAPGSGNFNLLAISPCIDAGNPDDGLDPDGTIADIGARYYHQASSSPLTLTFTPRNPPIQIPAGGGSFAFDAAIENTTSDPITFDAWTEVILPSGNVYGPLIRRNNLMIPGGAVIVRALAQFVPGNAPTGNYTMVGKVGVYPDSVTTFDSFPFVKLSGDGVPSHHQGWAVYGWEGSFDPVSPGTSDQSVLFGAYPNPFNPSTALSLQLTAQSLVKLAVYNVNGREVSRLADGWYPAGNYDFTWNAAEMPSGVYFAQLNAEGVNRTVKLLLVK